MTRACWLALVSLGCAVAHAEVKPASGPRLLSWSPDSSPNGVRLFVYREEPKKAQIFAFFDEHGLAGTTTVVAVEHPYQDKPCYRIAHAKATRRLGPSPSLVAYGPIDEPPAHARVVPVPADFDLAAGRTTQALDVNGDGQPDLIFAGPDCAQNPDGYHYCVDSYAHGAKGWTSVEHYADAEGCPRK